MRMRRGNLVARRSAFTLLEVVLALTLAIILLGAIFTAVDQSAKLTVSGREEMERSQLARALLRKFALDVRSIAYVPPVVTESDSATTGTSSTSTTGTTSTTSTASTASAAASAASTALNSTVAADSTTSTSDADEVTARSIGLRGNAMRVEMHISRARRDLEFSANLDGNKMQTHTSDLRVVTYQLGGTGTMTNLRGLVRTEGDRLATLTAEDKGATPTTLSMQQPLAPEVGSLQFRYFDGRAWYTSWDSEQAGRLPRAVEIVIGFSAPQVRPGPALRVNVSTSTNQFRSVVMIPIADPFPDEFVQ